jgi:hypothetical protein
VSKRNEENEGIEGRRFPGEYSDYRAFRARISRNSVIGVTHQCRLVIYVDDELPLTTIQSIIPVD